MKHPGLWLALGALIVAVVPCRGAAELRPVSLYLQWDHQSQFAGYYMAQDKGFYEAEGLDVTIVRGGPNCLPCESVGAGKGTFCITMLATALEKREAGIPLVLLAQVVNRSNFEIVAWKKPGGEGGPEILAPKDLQGRRVTIWETDFRTQYTAFFDSQGIHPEVLPQYYTLSLFLRHGADACSAMRYNEYHWLLQHGVREEDLTVFPLGDYGVPVPEDGIYALESTWKADPALCSAFARASLKGWEYARAHPDEALAATMTRVEEANLPTNRPHMRWMLEEILNSSFPDANGGWTFGSLSRASYEASCAMLLKYGVIAAAPKYETFVTKAESGNVESQ